MSKFFILLGIALFLIGVMLYFFPNIFSWFGKLPGDIHAQGRSGTFFFPIVSSIVISIVLTIVVNLFFRR